MLRPTYKGFVADASHSVGRHKQVLWPTQVAVLVDVNRYFYCCGWHRPVFLLTQASVVADAGQNFYCCGRHRQEFLLRKASVVTCVVAGAGQYFCGRK